MAEPRNTPVVCGVYFLFKDRVLTYVGQSKDCYGRIADHRSAGREFDLATVMPLAEEFVSQVETALIKSYQPPKNKAHNEAVRPAPPARFMQPILERQARRDAAPRPDGLGLISRAKARGVAQSLGLRGMIIDEAIEAGDLSFVESSKRGRGVICVALYSDIIAFLKVKQKEKLQALGFTSEHLDPAASRPAPAALPCAGGARG